MPSFTNSNAFRNEACFCYCNVAAVSRYFSFYLCPSPPPLQQQQHQQQERRHYSSTSSRPSLAYARSLLQAFREFR